MSRKFVNIGSLIFDPEKVSNVVLANDMLSITVYYYMPFTTNSCGIHTIMRYEKKEQTLETWDRLLNALCD